MKKLMLFAMVASLLVFAGCERETDTPDTPVTPPSGDGLFSVSEGKQVRFASGNLVYDNINGYRFAAHQYDYGGLFGWGTGSNPTNTSTDDHDYPTFDDWGNHIAGGWRTLTHDEWHYVIWDRAGAHSKCGVATVCGVHGLVLLPDNYFSGGTSNAGYDWREVYDASSWSEMEDAGAVFLPAAGRRYGTELGCVGELGCYWSFSDPDCFRFGMSFDEGYIFLVSLVLDYLPRYYGCSVRLVQDY